jgi:hypothetical protein
VQRHGERLLFASAARPFDRYALRAAHFTHYDFAFYKHTFVFQVADGTAIAM